MVLDVLWILFCQAYVAILLSLCFFFKQHTAYEVRISDWSSDVCSSDLQRREGEDRDRDSEAETTDNPKPSGSRRRHLEVGIGFQVAERLAQLPTDQRRQRRIRPDVPAKPERASKPVERHLRGACRAAPAVGCDMRDDMVTHLDRKRTRLNSSH